MEECSRDFVPGAISFGCRYDHCELCDLLIAFLVSVLSSVLSYCFVGADSVVH